jgi:siroheme synthase (precorrin-2 oxidase/ferrochelatase)
VRRAFYPVSLNVEGRACVVIGAADDREATQKAAALEESGACVRRICDVASLRDEELSARLRALADRHRFLLCCIDQPRYGFVAMAAIVKAGPVRVAISTAGLAPRVAKVLKNALQAAMDSRFAGFIENLAQQRERVRGEHPNPESSQLRRTAMIEAARGFRAEVRFEYPAWFERDDAER